MLYNASDAKLFGFHKIFAQFVEDMKLLETDGIDIQHDNFYGNVKVSIAQVVGDNLGIHSLLGFAEGFTANFPCRHCKMHRNETKRALIEEKEALRTPENYQHDLNRENLQETGIKSSCVLDDLTHFHTTSNRAPDIMHDILEGVCPLEVKLVLHELIQKGYFTVDQLNARITSYNYGYGDASNKPCTYSVNQLRSPDGSGGQNAGQMWCLIRHIGVMLGDLIPEDDPHWELLLALQDCMDIVFAPVISRGDVLFLEQLIKDHHMIYLELFPERHLKPKHHFMLHYPSAMHLLGPLITYWVMRFEAKHNFAKRLAHIVCNFTNITKTLAYRNQMQLCYLVMSRQTTVEREFEVGPGTSVILASLEDADVIAQSVEIPLYDEVYRAHWCKVHGIVYQENMMVVVDKTGDGDPLFGKIGVVLSVGTSVFLVCDLWETVGFRQHFHAYVVQPAPAKNVCVVKPEDLDVFYSLHANQSYAEEDRNYYISMRHK
nr:uncharacterized protein LOC129283670 [Lytechinus pictus]